MQAIEFFVSNKTFFTILHVLSVILGMGSALISDMLFNFFSKDKTLDQTEKRVLGILSNVVWYSLIIIVISGIALFFSNPQKYAESHKFISKMVILVVLLINGFVLHRLVQPHFNDRGILRFKSKQNIRRVAFAGGAISLVSWFVICILGLLSSIPVHFVSFLVGYFIFVLVAVSIALFVENKTFGHN